MATNITKVKYEKATIYGVEKNISVWVVLSAGNSCIFLFNNKFQGALNISISSFFKVSLSPYLSTFLP